MDDLELERVLEKEYVAVDIERLVKSNIKQIVIPLHRFVEWKVLDINENSLYGKKLFDSCLDKKSAKKACKLNKLHMTHVWNLLDEDVKKDMNFKDFVN